VVALVVFLAFYFAAKGVRSGIRRLSARRKQHQNVGLVLGRLAQGVIVFLGLLIALVIALPNFKPAQLVEFLGLSSVAIGFAFRDILQNFLAGILLLWNEPFRIGDQIKMGDFEGEVISVETRATMIRTYDGRRIVIPNGDLFTNPVFVNTAFDQRRVEYDVGIGYGDDIARARALILEALREVEGILDDPAPEVLVYEFGGSSVNLRVRWWIAPPRRKELLHSRDAVLEAIKNKLLASGIDLPFPTQHVLFHDQTEATDGDRARQREGWPAGKSEPPKARSIAAALGRLARESENDPGEKDRL
ncbi:MAG: mechanosensitive ion channel family protein, partial [Chthoniobacteraceae bacterium]